MMPITVKKWLSEYKTLPESQRQVYASSIRNNAELVQDLYELFEDDLSHEVIDPVCHQLFDFYRSQNVELQRFTLEFVPILVWTYLCALSYSDKKKCSGIEACLLGIYNLEVVDASGKAKVVTTTIPTLASNSLFHEPPSLAVLTESALTRYHSDIPRHVTVGPFPQLDNINAYNRLPVLTYIINRYNADIANLSAKSLEMICTVSSRLSRTGFDGLDTDSIPASTDHSDSTSCNLRRGVSFTEEPRIPLSSGLLVELLSAVYYAMFNGQPRIGMQALEDIRWRASYELFAEVILITSAVKNSLRFNPAGQPKDGPMGISIALSPTQGIVAFSKDAITNASFRARRLPEDIDVPDSGNNLGDIADEGNDIDILLGGSRALQMPGSDSKSSPVQHKSASSGKGPLKSIMKKREKVQRKESDVGSSSKRGSHFKEFLELHVSKSPSHSISMSGMSSATASVNGDVSIADASGVQLNLLRNSNASSNRQSLDADVGRMSRSSNVVTSDSMDDTILVRLKHAALDDINRTTADEDIDNGNDDIASDVDEANDDDITNNFSMSGTQL